MTMLLSNFIKNGTPALKEPFKSQWESAINKEIWTPKGLAEVIQYQSALDRYNIHPDAPDHDEQMRAMSKDYNRMMELWSLAMQNVPSTVLGLDMKMHSPHNRWLMALVLTEASQRLTPEQFHFWAGSDIPNVEMMRPNSDNEEKTLVKVTPEWFEKRKATLPEFANPEYVNLALAFKYQLVTEAKDHIPFIGDLVMHYEPIPALDALIKWQSLRLLIRPYGIWATFVNENEMFPIFWQPHRHTMRTLTGGIFAYIGDVVLAGIWRDACIVQERTWHERTTLAQRPLKKSQRHKSPITLPRTIYTVRWGASTEERETIVRATHAVRAHYRALGEGRKASKDAVSSADEYGMPHPPTGYTFVRPHLRGTGEAVPQEAIRNVICKGLKTIKIALGSDF